MSEYESFGDTENCKGLSVQQNMDQLFFAEDAGLRGEYDELYRSLFETPEPYMRIVEALGIAGVRTSVTTWHHKADDVYPKGAQIDLVIDRNDDLINLCEMKFCAGP